MLDWGRPARAPRPASPMRILAIEDEPDLRGGLLEALARAGHAADGAATGPEGLDMILGRAYDLVVLDVGLPGLDGLSVCREARRRGATMPILVLTARDALADKVAGLDAGADDYLVKPFELDELLARVRALLRRPGGERTGALAVGDLRLDPATGQATRGGRPVVLARKERALLEYLMRNRGRIITRDQILAHVWDEPGGPESDVVRAHVRLLRKAIADDGAPRLIETVHGIGYRMVDRAPEA